MRATGACRRFEEEGLLRIERGEPLEDEHYRDCIECIALQQEHERIKRALHNARHFTRPSSELASEALRRASGRSLVMNSALEATAEAAQRSAREPRFKDSRARTGAIALGTAFIGLMCGWFLADASRPKASTQSEAPTAAPAPTMEGALPAYSATATPTEAVTAGKSTPEAMAPATSVQVADAPALTGRLPRMEEDPCKDLTSFALKLCRGRQKHESVEETYGGEEHEKQPPMNHPDAGPYEESARDSPY